MILTVTVRLLDNLSYWWRCSFAARINQYVALRWSNATIFMNIHELIDIGWHKGIILNWSFKVYFFDLRYNFLLRLYCWQWTNYIVWSVCQRNNCLLLIHDISIAKLVSATASHWNIGPAFTILQFTQEIVEIFFPWFSLAFQDLFWYRF